MTTETRPAFTPGPWRILRQTPAEGFVGWLFFVIQDHGERNPIAPATLRTEDGVVAQVTEQDAHLLAAAPDLYEALRQMLAHADRACGACVRDEHVAARAALAKAEGR